MLLLKSSYFNCFDNISSHNGYFTYQIWYDNILIRIFSGFRIFPDFSGFIRIYPDFHQIFRFLHRMDCFLLSLDETIFFSGNLLGVRIFSGFFRIFLRFSDLNISLVIMDSLLLKFTMMTLFSKRCSGFRILPVIPDFLQIFRF